MPEYSGSLQSFEVAAFLWLAPLIPLVGAVYALLAGRPLARGPSEEHRLPDPVVVALGAVVGTLALVAGYTGVLVAAPGRERQLVSHAWNLLRIGSVDSSWTILLEPTTALLALAVCVAAGLTLGIANLELSDLEQRRRLAVSVNLGLFGLLLLLLADDWLLMVVGSAASGVASLISARASGASTRGFALGRVGDVALLGAGALLLWGLGGGWTGAGDYVPDFRARLAAAEIGEPSTASKVPEVERRDGSGLISMAALPGATLSLGGADLCLYDADGKRGGIGTRGRPCREIARSPFARLPLPAAVHDIQVSAGPGTNDLKVQWVRTDADRETLLVLTAGTLSPRELRAELELRDASGTHPLSAALTTRKALGLSLLSLVALLLGLAAALRGLVAPVSRVLCASSEESLLSAALLAAGTDLFAGAALLARTDFVLLLAPKLAFGFGVLAALGGVYAVARAAHALDPRRVLVGLALGELALGALGFVSGAHAGASVGLAVAALALAVVGLTLARVADEPEASLAGLQGRGARHPTLTRANQLATLALAGAPLPLVGAFWPRDAALQAAGSADAFGALSAWGSFGIGALLGGLTSFAAWRLHQLVFVATAKQSAKATPEPAHRLDTVLLGVAVSALLLGALLLPKALLGAGAAIFESWLAHATSTGAPLDQSVRLALLAVGFAAAVAGWALARARYGSARPKGWLERERARVGHGVFAAEPRALFDRALVTPVLGVAHWLGELETSLDTLAFGALPAEPEPVSSPPSPVEAEVAPERESAPEREPAQSAPAPVQEKKRKKKRGKGGA